MKQVTLPNGVLLLEVPEWSTKFKIKNGAYVKKLFIDGQWKETLNTSIHYKIIGLGKDLTEKDWEGIVERRKDLKDWPWKGYEPHKLTVCWNAKQSGLSLIASHSMKPETSLFIKQINTKKHERN